MTNVAYEKRNIPMIKFRKIIHGLIKGVRIINQIVFRIKNNRVLNNIVIIIDTDNLEDLGNIINRVFWGFPQKKGLQVKIKINEKFKDIKIDDIKSPTWQKNYLKESSHILLTTKISIGEYFNADLILVTNFIKSLLFVLMPYFSAKLEVADPLYYGWAEGNIWMKKFYFTNSKSDREYFDNISKNNFLKLENQRKAEKAYCFLTGPTFDNYSNYHYEEESLKIVCNTIIKNDEFLNYITKPDIVMFADCVFHFGPSKYASQFRERVVEIVKRYNCFIMVPKLTVPLLLAHYPFLKDYIIGLGVTSNYHFPKSDDLSVFGTKSISTYFMLPTASSLAEKIFFLGADGRKSNEKYFWKHNPKVQFSDLMETVFLTHPSFFRDRDYSSDYEEYCHYFEELIKFGESNGKQYYSLTKSYIPALSSRQYQD